MKSKILIISTKSITQNVFLKCIYRNLIKKNLDIINVSSDPENLDKIFTNTRKIYLPFINKKKGFNFFLIFIYILRTRKFLNENKKATFFLHTPLASYFIRFCSLFIKVKFIYFVHGYRFHPNGSFISNLFYIFIEKILSYKTYKYITINDYDYNFTKNYFSKECIKVKGVGIKYSNFIFPKKIEKNNDSFNIGVIAAYRRNKGYMDIISVAEDIKNIKEIKFKCYGYDSKLFYQNLINKKKLSNIELNSFTNELEKKFIIFDIILHLSEREGLSVSLIQSLKNGVPVVAYDVRGVGDLVLNRYNGILVKYSNKKKIVNVIENLFYDRSLLKKLSSGAQKSIDNEYDENFISKKVINFILQ